MNNHANAITSLSVDSFLDEEVEGFHEPLILSLKNGNLMDTLRTSLRAEATVTYQTSPVARIVRRDWNIVSAKLFVSALDHDYAKKIRADVSDMTWQMQDVLDVARTLPIPDLDTSWMRPRELRLQIVHPLAAQWLRAFTLLDQAYAILINAELDERITPEMRWQIIAPAQMAYMGFKATAMRLPLKSTAELLEEAGI